jgi:hypothetical protein
MHFVGLKMHFVRLKMHFVELKLQVKNQGLKNKTKRNGIYSIFSETKCNKTKRKIFEKTRNENKRNDIQRNETETKKEFRFTKKKQQQQVGISKNAC